MTWLRSALRRLDAALLVVAALALPAGCTSTEPSASRGEPEVTRFTAQADESVRIKGLAPHIRIHRQRDGRVEQLRDGAVARQGDLVQVSYMAAGNRHGVVVSLDGGGGVTLHHPARPSDGSALVSRGEHALDHAYELDGARAYERFVFVTSGEEPIDVAEVLTAARELARGGEAARHSPLPLPGRWQQSSLTLRKQP